METFVKPKDKHDRKYKIELESWEANNSKIITFNNFVSYFPSCLSIDLKEVSDRYFHFLLPFKKIHNTYKSPTTHSSMKALNLLKLIVNLLDKIFFKGSLPYR